jgi:hypothetical protein
MTPAEWMTELFGSPMLSDQVLTVCWKEEKLSFAHVRITDTERAAQGLVDYSAITCTWLGCCPLIRTPLHGRGGASDTGALVGVWADVDIAGPGHRQAGALPLPADVEQALTVVDSIGVPPTHVLHSGGGLQVWWLFTEPWLFASDTERAEASALSGAFGHTVRKRAAELGHHVDDVSDLARILRPVGTWNRKLDNEPRPVERIGGTGGRLLTADIEDILLPPDPTPPPAEFHHSTDTSPADVFARHTTWADLLAPYGWQQFRHSNGHPAFSTMCPKCGQRPELWSHPKVPLDDRGNPDHASASACHVLYLFSDSHPNGLPPRTPFTKFRTYAHLWHSGALSAAARAINALRGGQR